MSLEELTYWKIHDYLKGKLSGDELIQFQRELNTNETLRDEVEMHRMANQMIINNRLNAAKNVSYEIQSGYKRKALLTKILTGGILSAVMLTGLFVFLKTKDTEITTQQKTKAPTTNKTSTQSVETKTSEIVHETKNASPNKTVSKQTLETENINKAPVVNLQPQTVVATNTPSVPVQNTPTIATANIEAEKAVTSTDPCSGVSITAIAQGSTTCSSEENGSITVSSFKGGKAPYRFDIFSEHGNTKMTNKHLPSGKYTVHLFDQNNCISTIENILVKGVDCETKEIAFNPFLGETYRLDGNPSGGVFVVYDKTGSIYFKHNILANQEFEWNGNSLNGEPETGHFAFEIIYQDGTKKQGTLTITR